MFVLTDPSTANKFFLVGIDSITSLLLSDRREHSITNLYDFGVYPLVQLGMLIAAVGALMSCPPVSSLISRLLMGQQFSNGDPLPLQDSAQVSDLAVPDLCFLFEVGGFVAVTPHTLRQSIFNTKVIYL